MNVDTLVLLAVNMIARATVDEDTYKCYSGGALVGFAIGTIWQGPELAKALGVIATLAGWTVPGNALTECIW